MGKNNKARRAAKAKTKAKNRSGGRGGPPPWTAGTGATGGGSGRSSRSAWDGPSPADEPQFSRAELVRGFLTVAAKAHSEGEPIDHGLLYETPFALVCREAEAIMRIHLPLLWKDGWQPSELHRQGRRGSTAAGGRLVGLAMAADDAGRRATTLDRRWRAQMEELQLPSVDPRSGWMSSWTKEEGFEQRQAIDTVVAVLADLLSLPSLEPVLPPPGSADIAEPAGSSTGAAVGAETNPILGRIRGLLAKAESTTFEAEATALTAKAQQLMTRHAIDAALVQARPGSDEERPIAIRVPIDAPYADAKSLLLQIVAAATRCQAVFHHRVALSTVVGFPADVAAVEMLFTSLLVQAQAAMADAAKRAPAGARPRSQRYRSAFLLGYANRIDDRLTEINQGVIAEAEAEHGSSFLPVLRSREAAVADFMTERFGELISSRVRGGWDFAGHSSGQLAANRAQLAFGDLSEGAAAS